MQNTRSFQSASNSITQIYSDRLFCNGTQRRACVSLPELGNVKYYISSSGNRVHNLSRLQSHVGAFIFLFLRSGVETKREFSSATQHAMPQHQVPSAYPAMCRIQREGNFFYYKYVVSPRIKMSIQVVEIVQLSGRSAWTVTEERGFVSRCFYTFFNYISLSLCI